MTINKPHLCTKLPIWAPRYSSAFTDTEERVALLAQYKVAQASPVIIVEFTKADHLKSLRFCILRGEAMRYPLDTNGRIPCYAIPMSALETWQSGAEVHDLAMALFE